MSLDRSKITVEEIEGILPTLSRRQILELDMKIHEYLETSSVTRASETAFSEWADPAEDIYNEEV